MSTFDAQKVSDAIDRAIETLTAYRQRVRELVIVARWYAAAVGVLMGIDHGIWPGVLITVVTVVTVQVGAYAWVKLRPEA